MIVVKIELWPQGDRSRKRDIGLICIANDGSGTKESGNYNAVASHSGVYFGKRKEPWKTVEVKNHSRALSPYHLVKRVLDKII